MVSWSASNQKKTPGDPSTGAPRLLTGDYTASDAPALRTRMSTSPTSTPSGARSSRSTARMRLWQIYPPGAEAPNEIPFDGALEVVGGSPRQGPGPVAHPESILTPRREQEAHITAIKDPDVD